MIWQQGNLDSTLRKRPGLEDPHTVCPGSVFGHLEGHLDVALSRQVVDLGGRVPSTLDEQVTLLSDIA